MHFQRKEFVDKTREKTVRKYIVLIVVLTMCPAVYLTFGIIKSTFYEAAATRFINDQLSFENTQVLDKKISYEHKEVRVVLIGPEVPDASISIARSKLKEYKLEMCIRDRLMKRPTVVITMGRLCYSVRYSVCFNKSKTF